MPARLISVLLAATLARASVKPATHPHVDAHRLPSRWYHEEDHPIYSLFRRGGSNDGVAYAAIGTPDWSAGFPGDITSATPIPQAWLDALNKAVADGKIPDIPLSTTNGTDNPSYPASYDPNSPEVCSSTYKCITPGDIWDAPSGVIALSFDDGPLPPSTTLYKFLREHNERVTHFFIGQNMVKNPQVLAEAIETNGDDLAIHTWSHPYMTTKSNEEVVAELGWTMLLVHNSTGGRVPRFWRPPYGDCDMRVRAIAKEVLGLTTVIWNQDTNDWTLDQNPPGTTLDQISTQMQSWLTGPKIPGLVILEHELSDLAVSSFISAYPLMVSSGWNRVSLAQMDGLGAYQNAFNATSPVALARVGDHVKPPSMNMTSNTTGTPTPSASTQPTSSSSKSGNGDGSGTPHANQKSGAERFSGAAPLILSGITTLVAALAGSIIL